MSKNTSNVLSGSYLFDTKCHPLKLRDFLMTPQLLTLWQAGDESNLPLQHLRQQRTRRERNDPAQLDFKPGRPEEYMKKK